MKASNDHPLSWVVSQRCRWCCSRPGRLQRIGNGGVEEHQPKNPDTPELFSIPQEQMSHVQVLTVQPLL